VWSFVPVGLADVVDIVLVSALLYAAVVWLRSTRAALVVRGFFVLGGVYVVARLLQLQLTAWLFQGFFAVFVVIIVIIFQEELRQIFERIALWSLGRKAGPALESETTDVLLRTLADFAKVRTGALIVIKGKQPLERHIEGGIELGGKLSEPLLRSIFDTHSPGHDGAVVIEGDRLARFAGHLPLSTDFAQLSGLGTRHGAALGLAERTDALCLVVSEERGRISYARAGRLVAAPDLHQLAAVVGEFLREVRPPTDSARISARLLREDWIEKGLALAVATALWYAFVPGAQTTEVAYEIPVQVEHVPAGLVVDAIEPPEITATFTGLRRAFYLFDQGRLEATVDVSLARLGRRTFRISEENLRYPKRLTLTEVSPSAVKISMTRKQDVNGGPEAAGAGSESKDKR